MKERHIVLGAALGAVAAAVLVGKHRRDAVRGRLLALLHGGARQAERAGRAVGARVYGMAPPEVDDVTLARKVETEIFRPADVPKGKIDVNAQNGVVQLRGEADTSEMIARLVKQARKVRGVREVENLLHLPNAKAPMHQ